MIIVSKKIFLLIEHEKKLFYFISNIISGMKYVFIKDAIYLFQFAQYLFFGHIFADRNALESRKQENYSLYYENISNASRSEEIVRQKNATHTSLETSSQRVESILDFRPFESSRVPLSLRVARYIYHIYLFKINFFFPIFFARRNSVYLHGRGSL